MMKLSDKAKKILTHVLMLILTIVGLALVFNEQIKSFIVNHMQENALEQPIKKHPKSGDFNTTNVKAISPEDILKASMKKNAGSIGKIAIPKVGLKLPIFYGMAQNNMVRGACTMRSNEEMGMQGNYTLAGHHMMDNEILFGPLQNVQDNDLIYLTDGQKVYTYQVQQKKVVSEYQTYWIKDVSDKHLITLITCASGHEGETCRIIVRGILTSVQDLNKENAKVFN